MTSPGFVHLFPEAERAHVRPDLLDVGETLLLQALLARVLPASGQVPVSKPYRVLLLVIDNDFVDGLCRRRSSSSPHVRFEPFELASHPCGHTLAISGASMRRDDVDTCSIKSDGVCVSNRFGSSCSSDSPEAILTYCRRPSRSKTRTKEAGVEFPSAPTHRRTACKRLVSLDP